MSESEARGFIKVPQGSDLRCVEKDALVGRIMQKRAKELCSEYVKRKFRSLRVRECTMLVVGIVHP